VLAVLVRFLLAMHPHSWQINIAALSGTSGQWTLEMIATHFFCAHSWSVQIAGSCQVSKRQLWNAARELIPPEVQTSERSELTK
jgi:hypothetical protein